MVYTISLAYAEVPTGEHFVKVRGSSSNIQLVEVVSIGSQLFYDSVLFRKAVKARD